MIDDERQLPLHQQEQKTADKQNLWQQRSRELDNIKDGLGKGIDNGIKETVVALNVLGINTTQSCEGHLDWGTGAPWIDLRAPNIDELAHQMYDAFETARTTSQNAGRGPSEEDKQLFNKAHELRLEVKRRNLEEAAKAMGLLDTFYKDRDVPYDRRLIISIASAEYNRIESQGAEFQETASPETKQQKLVEYQHEMQAFTAFLKDTYFSSPLLPSQNDGL